MSSRHGHITIECDAPGCESKFPSLSFLVGGARKLAMESGWWKTAQGRYKNEDFCSEDCEKRLRERNGDQ
jgi:hypothetical protein